MAVYIYDSFRVAHPLALNAQDTHNVTLLYLPLMGIDSFALYQLLASLESDETYTFKRVLDTLNFNSIQQINKALDKLQGLGLLRVFQSESKGYFFEIKSPLAKHQFIQDELLSSLLESQLGEGEFKKLFAQKKQKPSGYTETTKSFQDVFVTSTRSISKTMDTIASPQIPIVNQEFNYTLFKILFDTSFISEEVLDNPDFRHHVERISFAFKLNEEEMKDVIIQTIDVDRNFEYASIARNAKNAFQRKYKSTAPRIETIQDDQYLTSIQDDDMRLILSVIENMSIADLLQSISNIKPSASEISMFDDLRNNTNFPSSVINFMVLYVSHQKGGELPNYNYFEKIANTWARAKVTNAYDAWQFTIKAKEKATTKTKSFSTEKKSKPLPSWYPDYMAQLKKDESKVELSEGDKQELLEIVKDMFD